MLTAYGDDQAHPRRDHGRCRRLRARSRRAGADLVSAVRKVAAGESTLDPLASRQVMMRLRERMTSVDPVASLSAQEKRVLELIGEGLTNRQIAERMFLAEKTVKNYVSVPAHQAGHASALTGCRIRRAPG